MQSARCCIERGEHSFVHGLFQTYNLATQNLMTNKSLYISWVLSWIILRVQMELVTYEAISVFFFTIVCLHVFLRYSACKSTLFYVVLYCHLWHAWLYHICPHYLINGKIDEKNIVEHKICFDFPYKFFWNISHSQKNSAMYYHKGM
jgi:hypothetical protein